jgi:Xaa-Pro aminopeptidase
VTEYTAGEKLAGFRRMAPECRGLSFGSICGYQANGAMMHYAATSATAAKLERAGLFLVDSGGQYFEGTVDTTRTVALGPVCDEARRDYTLVLKGLIGLSRARFLSGTTGTGLDILARAPLWAEGIDYKCGTGHGIGFYLNVHEGPHGISQAWNANPLKPGMVVTVEPGVYNAGRYGIRSENMILVAADRKTDSGEFLRFETLTVCPFDTAPLLPELLDAGERAWLNEFHLRVRERLLPLLPDAADREWLERKTRPV